MIHCDHAASFPGGWTDTIIFSNLLSHWQINPVSQHKCRKVGEKWTDEKTGSTFKIIGIILSAALKEALNKSWVLCLCHADSALGHTCMLCCNRALAWEEKPRNQGPTVLCQALPLTPGKTQQNHLTSGAWFSVLSRDSGHEATVGK